MMIGNQVFAWGDFPTVIMLAILEGLLSADNALVLAIMVKHLPKEQQQKALLYGLGGAFVFRFVAILFATIILQQWWLQAVGAIYLVFVTVKHFKHAANKTEMAPVKRGFWATVIAVEITDIAFAVDSVLAGITFIDNKQSKIWVVYFGAIIGIVLLRFAASFFIKLLDKYPALDHVAYVLVGWVGVKLAFMAAHTWNAQMPELPKVLFWGVLLSVATIGTILATRKADTEPPEHDAEAEMIDDAQDFEFGNDEKSNP